MSKKVYKYNEGVFAQIWPDILQYLQSLPHAKYFVQNPAKITIKFMTAKNVGNGFCPCIQPYFFIFDVVINHKISRTKLMLY